MSTKRDLSKTSIDKMIRQVSFDPKKQPILARLFDNTTVDYLVTRAYEELSLAMIEKPKTPAQLQEVLCATTRILLVAMVKNGLIQAKTEEGSRGKDSGRDNTDAPEAGMGGD